MIYLLERNVQGFSPSEKKIFTLNNYSNLEKFSVKSLISAFKKINDKHYRDEIMLLVLNARPIVGIKV